MNAPPGPPWGSPPTPYPQPSQPPAPYGYPPQGAPPPLAPGANTKLASRLFLAFAVIAVGGVIALTAVQARAEEKANWLVFQGDRKLHAKIDGDDVGALGQKLGVEQSSLAVKLGPGTHTVEIVQGSKVIESGTVTGVPAEHYRALWAVGEARAWGVVQVGYGETPKGPPLQKLVPSAPHLYVLPAEPVLLKNDLEMTNVGLPKVVRTKGTKTIRRICALKEDGEPTCI